MFSEFFESFWWLLVLIGVMIIVHELGHYWAARFFDVKVDAFSFGFGPRLFGFRKGETDFRFSLILLGGYVKMAGEQPGDESSSDPRGFLSKPRWQRMIIAFAGPAMNIILAVVILTGLFMVHYPRVPMKTNPVIGYLSPDGQAAKAGLLEGDRIVKVDQIENPTWHSIQIREIDDTNTNMLVTVERGGERKEINMFLPANERTHLGSAGWIEERDVRLGDFRDFGKNQSPARDAGMLSGDLLKTVNGKLVRTPAQLNLAVMESAGKPVDIVFDRNGQEMKVSVKPRWQRPDGSPQEPERWMIGIHMQDGIEIVKLSFPEALRESVSKNTENAGLIYRFLQGMVERRVSPKSMDGPIGMASMARRAAHEGPTYFFDLMTMVSLNLAIFNLLPIPILDGGVILMLLIEMIRRQDLSLQIKEAVLKAGFAFLMMVVVFVLYNDISKQRAESAAEATQQRQMQSPAKAPPAQTAPQAR
jgi:regulator of sigma E protease